MPNLGNIIQNSLFHHVKYCFLKKKIFKNLVFLEIFFCRSYLWSLDYGSDLHYSQKAAPALVPECYVRDNRVIR
jgi:hypothetical protein